MINNLKSLILDLAMYPKREAVQAAFKKESSMFGSEYEQMQAVIATSGQYVQALEYFIFGTNTKKLIEQVKNTESYWLMVEWGSIDSKALDRMRWRDASIEISLTVGYPDNKRNLDDMEQMLVSNYCLYYLKRIFQIQSGIDEQTCKRNRIFENGWKFTPLEPELLFQNYGWVARINVPFDVLS